MYINRCICFNIDFATMKAVADEANLKTVQELQQKLQFGKNCRMCHPYVRRMLRTGETAFRQIIRESDEPEPL